MTGNNKSPTHGEPGRTAFKLTPQQGKMLAGALIPILDKSPEKERGRIAAWAKLGGELGFDPSTIRDLGGNIYDYEVDPVTFTAVSVEPLSVREAAIKLLAELGVKTHNWNPSDRWDAPMLGAISGLQMALQNERSATLDVERPELVAEAIGRMKAGQAIAAEHVRAVVEAAEIALGNATAFRIQWEANARAIKRWQAGEPHPDVKAAVDAAQALFRILDGKIDGEPGKRALDVWERTDDDGLFPAIDALAKAVGALVKGFHAPEGARELIWPDHADLVVWLVELLEHRPACPELAEVEALVSVIGRAGQWHAGAGAMSGTALDGAKVAESLRQLANSLIAASRRVIVAESKVTGIRRLIPVEVAPIAKPPAGQDRAALEANVNRYLANAAHDAGVEHARSDIPGVVGDLAPSWTYEEVTGLDADAPPRVVLIKYEPDAPL